MSSIIEVDNLTKTFIGGVNAVREISFNVEAGEIFGFLGPNGAGKSTTIMMLTTLIAPTSGSARVAEFDVVAEPEQVRLSLGYISQDLAVDDHLTGRANLYLQAGFYHLSRKKALERTEELLALVGLETRADDAVETYSGGMRKRLDIAAGLIHRPKVLFLDEPTLGLDIQTRYQIWQYINHLRKEREMTIFVTTHYMDEADSLCDRIAIIDHGRIKTIDSPDRLKNRLGAELVRIKFGEKDDDKIARALRCISDLAVVERVERQDGQCTAVVKNGDAAIPAIFSATYPSGLKISSVTLKKPSLDDVYMAFTGKELRNETGSRENAHRSHMMLRRMRS
ncbi:MAG: ATP-binding cassette domain-containing protein [Desulfobacteraceae bacterium]